MNSLRTQGRDELHSRVSAIRHLIAEKIGIQNSPHDLTLTDDVNSSNEEVHRQLIKPFRSWWDFDKPWRNK